MALFILWKQIKPDTVINAIFSANVQSGILCLPKYPKNPKYRAVGCGSNSREGFQQTACVEDGNEDTKESDTERTLRAE